MHYSVGQELLLTVFSVDSTQSHSCTVQRVDGDAVELQIHSSGKGKVKIPRDASGFLVGKGDEQPVSVLIDDVSRLPTVRCVVEHRSGQRRSYVRVCGRFPLRYRLLSQREYLKAKKEYSPRAGYFGANGVAPAESWMASAKEVEEWGTETRYLARSLAELHRKMDLVISLLPQSRLREGECARQTELGISGSGIDFETRERLPAGHYLELEMWPPIIPSEKIVVLGRILRADAISRVDGGEPAFQVAVEFTVIGEYERDKIIQYVFGKQREELRVKRLAGTLENNG